MPGKSGNTEKISDKKSLIQQHEICSKKSFCAADFVVSMIFFDNTFDDLQAKTVKFRIALVCPETWIIPADIAVTGIGNGNDKISLDFVDGKVNVGFRQSCTGFDRIITEIGNKRVQVGDQDFSIGWK